jgi:hypothetical protein
MGVPIGHWERLGEALISSLGNPFHKFADGSGIRLRRHDSLSSTLIFRPSDGAGEAMLYGLQRATISGCQKSRTN